MPLTLSAQDYTPMTEAKAVEWLKGITIYEAVNFMIIADDWEHSVPKLKMPDVYAVLDDNGDLYIMFNGKMDMIVGTVRPLEYTWTIPEVVLEEFYEEEKKPVWPWLAVGGGGIVAGLVAGFLLAR